MSLFVFTRASQFAAVGLIAAGGTGAAAVASALQLASRNTFYGIALGQYLTKNRLLRLAAAQLTIDESTALTLAQEKLTIDARPF